MLFLTLLTLSTKIDDRSDNLFFYHIICDKKRNRIRLFINLLFFIETFIKQKYLLCTLYQLTWSWKALNYLSMVCCKKRESLEMDWHLKSSLDVFTSFIYETNLSQKQNCKDQLLLYKISLTRNVFNKGDALFSMRISFTNAWIYRD